MGMNNAKRLNIKIPKTNMVIRVASVLLNFNFNLKKLRIGRPISEIIAAIRIYIISDCNK
jgi:hypothetical protein